MVVQVVAAQVGEHRGVELHGLAPALFKGMRGYFHGDPVHAPVQAACQDLVQAKHVGRGPVGLRQVVERPVPQCPDQAPGPVNPLPGLRQEVRHGRLAVGARHAGYGHQVRGSGPEQRGELTQALPQPRDAHHGYFQFRRGGPLVADHRDSPVFDCLVHMLDAMAVGALHGHESVTVAHRPRILAEAADRHFRAIAQPAFQQGAQTHPVSHGRAPAAAPDCTISAEKSSGGMSSRRKAPLTTLANSGAATSPP